ncbi:MAG: hypothetical protein ACHQJ6_01385 [Candidatus Berkiellales bacterium]
MTTTAFQRYQENLARELQKDEADIAQRFSYLKSYDFNRFEQKLKISALIKFKFGNIESCFTSAKNNYDLKLLEALYKGFGDISVHVSEFNRQTLALQADEASADLIFSNPGMKNMIGFCLRAQREEDLGLIKAILRKYKDNLTQDDIDTVKKKVADSKSEALKNDKELKQLLGPPKKRKSNPADVASVLTGSASRWTYNETRIDEMYEELEEEAEHKEAFSKYVCLSKARAILSTKGVERCLNDAINGNINTLLIRIVLRDHDDISTSVSEKTRKDLACVAGCRTEVTARAILSNKGMKDMVPLAFHHAARTRNIVVITTILREFKNHLPKSKVEDSGFKRFVEGLPADLELKQLLLNQEGFGEEQIDEEAAYFAQYPLIDTIRPVEQAVNFNEKKQPDRLTAQRGDLSSGLPPRPMVLERKSPEGVREIPQAQPQQQPEQQPQQQSQQQPEATGSLFSFVQPFVPSFLSGLFSSSTPPAQAQMAVRSLPAPRQIQGEGTLKRSREEINPNPGSELKRVRK